MKKTVKVKAASAATSARATKSSPTPEPVEGMPLFFRQPAVLDKERHATAGLKPSSNVAFAKGTNSLPLNTIEFLEASKFYPIVFTADAEPTPTAIVGMEKTNYFVDAKGQWQAGSYIPAYVRQYPFIFFQPPQGEMYYLCVDEGSPIFTAQAGKRDQALFDKEEPSELTRRALQFCTSFYQQLAITRNFCADLAKHNLLVPYHSQVTTQDGRTMSLSGFTMIDEKAFNALPDEVILEFRRKGWLAFIYLALASATNWKRVLELANKSE